MCFKSYPSNQHVSTYVCDSNIVVAPIHSALYLPLYPELSYHPYKRAPMNCFPYALSIGAGTPATYPQGRCHSSYSELE